MPFSIFTPKKEYVPWDRGIPPFLSFSCFPWTLWSPSRVAGMRLGFRLQLISSSEKIRKEREPCCICCLFCGGKQGPSCNLWVTCSMHRHPVSMVAWAAKAENSPESGGILVDCRERQSQMASRGRGITWRNSPSGMSPISLRKTERILASFLQVASVRWGQTEPEVTFPICSLTLRTIYSVATSNAGHRVLALLRANGSFTGEIKVAKFSC